MVGVAFAARLAIRMWAGEASYGEDGYTFYRVIAERFVRGEGLCFGPDDCALRPPVYALVLVPFVALGVLYPGVVILQAAVGAALVPIAFALGRDLFGRPAGLAAAGLTAVSPYAVVHDTALQETVLVNALTAAAVWSLLRASRAKSGWTLLASGALVATAILTTARVLLIAPWLIVWIWVATNGPVSNRLQRVALLTLPILLLVGGWVVRNWQVVGAPVLTTETGTSLWVANNRRTLEYFPSRSIDLAARHAFEDLKRDRRADFDRAAGDPVAFDRFLASVAFEYIRLHPAETVRNMARKAWVVVSAELSPSRSPLVNGGYRVVYGVVHILAAIGFWRARRDRDHWLIGGLLAAFLVTTAVFWSHTSHRSLIDLFLFVYAAAALGGDVPRGALAVRD
jgi:4-amino-4-deoxy-L-arabinose transferase-like glycosyltransferase